MFTIEPPLSLMYWLYASRIIKKDPCKFVSTTAANPRRLSSLLSWINCPPELLTSIFKAPYFSTMCSIKFSICSSLRMFVEGPTTTRPPLEDFFSKTLISSAAFWHFSTFRLAITTVAPSKANSVVMDRPIPVPPPVTRATLFLNKSSRKQLFQLGGTAGLGVAIL